MARKPYRAMPETLAFDAYYRDEWGVVNEIRNCSSGEWWRAGFHKSRFTLVQTEPKRLEEPEEWCREASNDADPHRHRSLRDRSNPVPKGTDPTFDLRIFPSATTKAYALRRAVTGAPWTEPVSVTLFHAVGHELNRHGLRSVVEQTPGQRLLIMVPGIEPEKKDDPRYGLTVGRAQIDTILQAVLGTKVPFRVSVLAAYSTGSCGLNQSLLNELVPLDEVERIVFYDCLYSKQCGDTAAALKRVRTATGGRAKIVAYKTSEAGNSYVNGSRLAVDANNPGLLDRRGIIEGLFQNKHYQAAIIHRALEGAVADDVVELGPVLTPLFEALSAVTVPRGSFVSSATSYRWVHGEIPSGKTVFQDWVKANRKVVDGFAAKLGNPWTKGTFRHVLWANQLPGWEGGMGEEKHDLLLPDFAWEYLLE